MPTESQISTVRFLDGLPASLYIQGRVTKSDYAKVGTEKDCLPACSRVLDGLQSEGGNPKPLHLNVAF